MEIKTTQEIRYNKYYKYSNFTKKNVQKIQFFAIQYEWINIQYACWKCHVSSMNKTAVSYCHFEQDMKICYEMLMELSVRSWKQCR